MKLRTDGGVVASGNISYLNSRVQRKVSAQDIDTDTEIKYIAICIDMARIFI
jgi:hypothetical protein